MQFRLHMLPAGVKQKFQYLIICHSNFQTSETALVFLWMLFAH